eukprot:gene29557-39184_t
MDDSWFFNTFGFKETMDNVRGNITIIKPSNGSEAVLKSRAKNKFFPIGNFTLPSVREIREQLNQTLTTQNTSVFSFSPASISYEHIIVDSVRGLHTSKVGALFQAASQFNCLEFPSPSVTPEDGITDYIYDYTQGPNCALACAAGTLYRYLLVSTCILEVNNRLYLLNISRNYFHQVRREGYEDQVGQTADNQINNLEDVERFVLLKTGKRFWNVRNGYTFSSVESLQALSMVLETIPPSEITDRIRIGLHTNVGVTDADGDVRVSQAYCSAMSCSYSGIDNDHWKSIASLALDGAYEATILSALLQSSQQKNAGSSITTEVYLTFVGGGVYGNDQAWIAEAIGRALAIAMRYIDNYGLELSIKLCYYKSLNQKMKKLIDEAYQRHLTAVGDIGSGVTSQGDQPNLTLANQSSAVDTQSTIPTVLRTFREHSLDQPRMYLSEAQRSICAVIPKLSGLVDHLPGWVPARLVADALGYGQSGIDHALESLGGRSYLWATEFENVHSTWNFDEPALVIEGKRYSNAEAFYHAQKPFPFDAGLWHPRRVDVMRQAVRAKLAASDHVRELLMATHPHALLAIKEDRVWGFHPLDGGQNLLAELLMQERNTYFRGGK